MKKVTFILIIFFVFVLQFTLNATDDKVIRVGVYGDNGSSVVCVTETVAALKIDPAIKPTVVKGVDIANGILNSLDVIIFPGGSGSKEASSMGETGRKRVEDFIRKEGKGCIGICAGGYLLSSTPVYKWSLKLTSSSVIDRAHYNRGRGLIKMVLTEKGKRYFPELKKFKYFFLQYYDGPILVRSKHSELPKYIELGKYVTDIHLTGGSSPGVTPGKTSLLFNTAGKGRVFVVTGHPEATPGMRWMIPRMARIVAHRNIISYPETVVRPERESKAILFDKERARREKNLFWKLVGDSAPEKISSLKELVAMRSRPALRWSMGLLRDGDPEVRSCAARVLAEAEYTPAIKDIEAALKVEKDTNCLKTLKASLVHLKKIGNE